MNNQNSQSSQPYSNASSNNATSLKQKPPQRSSNSNNNQMNQMAFGGPSSFPSMQPQQFSDQQRAFIQSGVPQQHLQQPFPSQYMNSRPVQSQMLQQPQSMMSNFPPNGPSSNYLVPSSMPMQPLQIILQYSDDEPIEQKASGKTDANQQEAQDLKDIIQLSMKIKQSTVHSSSFTEQTFPFLVSLQAGNSTAELKVPIDLVCVIDRSGSMSGAKIDLVKNTFTYLLEFLDENDRLSIITFQSDASRLVPFMRMTKENKQKIFAALKSVQASGGTNIDLGMRHAFEVLKQRRYFNPVSSIFLLSDGLDGGAQDRTKATMQSLKVPEDLTINTFGYGRDHDPQLMTDLANLRDGNFYFIDKLDMVDETFVDCLGALINSVAQNAHIKIRPEQSDALKDVKIVKAYGDASMWTQDNQVFTTKMATLMSGKQKDYVLEITIPKNTTELQDHQKNIKIASAEVTVTGLDNKQVTKTAELVITLLNELEEVKDQEGDNKEVMQNFYRVKGAELLEQARILADQRRNDDAKKLLQGFKEEISNSFLKGEEFIQNMIKDLDKALGYLNPVVYQNYGRHNMWSNQRAQMQQRTDMSMNNCQQMPQQAAMTNQVRAWKGPQNQSGNGF